MKVAKKINKIAVVMVMMALILICGMAIVVPKNVSQPTPTVTTQNTPTPITKPAPPTESPNLLYCTVTSTALNVRECAGIDCQIIGWLRAGQFVIVSASFSQDWANLSAGGWVHSNYLTCKGDDRHAQKEQ